MPLSLSTFLTFLLAVALGGEYRITPGRVLRCKASVTSLAVYLTLRTLNKCRTRIKKKKSFETIDWQSINIEHYGNVGTAYFAFFVL